MYRPGNYHNKPSNPLSGTARAQAQFYRQAGGPDPIPGSRLGLELWPSDHEKSWVYFNNLKVCELTGPYVPLPTPEQ
jgi:hypothetical protein